MKRFGTIAWAAALVIGYLAGYGTSPRSVVSGQAGQAPALQGALPAGDYSKMNATPDQGGPLHFSIDEMKKGHVEMIARAKRNQPGPAPKEIFPSAVTRTHSYIMVHREAPATPPAGGPGIEIHEGVTDVYYIVSGGGTVIVGGEVENKRTVRPGEYTGTLKSGGQRFKLKAGDILNIPPNMVHATIPDPGEGMTYVLMKVNIGLYPWSLVAGTP